MNTITIPKDRVGQRIQVSSGPTQQFQLPGQAEAHVLEIDDAHFLEASAVLLPDPSPGDDAAALEAPGRVTGVRLIARALQYADEADERALIIGHADAAEKNVRPLAHARAKATLAALVGSRDRWTSAVRSFSRTADHQTILTWIAATRGWTCHPGPIDDVAGPKTRSGVRGFQRTYNYTFHRSIDVDGIVGPQTWGAVFDVYMEELAHVLETDAVGLAAYQDRLDLIEGRLSDFGAKDAYPLSRVTGADYRSLTGRRAEVHFFMRGEEPPVQAPQDDPLSSPVSDVYDPLWYRLLFIEPVKAPKRVETGVEITEIEGLYKPGHDDGEKKLSGYEKGYKSEDDRGRIFVNHKPLTQAADWQDAWAKDTQYVEFTAKLDPSPDALPADVRVVWEWEDPDDPSNDGMRDDAAQYVDRSDYGTAGHLGSQEGDNRGECDFPSAGSGSGARFEEVAPYALTVVNAAPRCETLVVGNESKLRMHCTNVGGDNFIVRARVKPHPRIRVTSGDETGVMSMWKRVDVEYRKMPDAMDLPVADVPAYFEPAFVQMDISDPLPTPKKEFICQKDDEESDAAAKLVKAPPHGIFEHEYKPGWLLLVSALGAAKEVGTATSSKVYDGPGSLRTLNYGGADRWQGVAVPKDITEKVAFVRLKEGSDEITIPVWRKLRHTPKKGHTHLDLYGVDYQSDFEPGNGRLGGAGKGGAYHRKTEYYPQYKLVRPSNHWVAGGMRFPSSKVEVEVWTTGSIRTSGISPTNNGHFAGRTVIFTRRRINRLKKAEEERAKALAAGDHKRANEIKDWIERARKQTKESLLGTIVHEFTHAFGFPHKCGYYTFEKPAKSSCCMNYYNTWVYAEETGSTYTVRAGDGGLQKIALENDLDSWRDIYHHPRNVDFRASHPDPNTLSVGDTFWMPTKKVQRFDTGESGIHLCGKHIDGVRRVHLEDNPHLWKR